jgi:hypothetical protein
MGYGRNVASTPREKITSVVLDDEKIDEWLRVVTKCCSNIEIMTLHGAQIKEGVIQFLLSLKHLKVLKIEYVPLKSRDCIVFRRFLALEELLLSHVNLDDGAVPCLSECTQLKRMILIHTGISQQGYLEIKSALPDVDVVYDE